MSFTMLQVFKRIVAYPVALIINQYNQRSAHHGCITRVPDWKHNYPSWSRDISASVQIKSVHGFDVIADAQDYIGRQIIMHKDWEPLIGKTIKALLPDHGIAFDVGSNMGYHSLNMSKCARNGLVYSFEPDLRNMRALLSNIALNRARNIVPLGIALSDVSSVMEMNVQSGVNYGTSTLRKVGDGSAFQKVVALRMDQLPLWDTTKMVNLVKIDVEGFEVEVIRGIGQMLDRLQYVICEINPHWSDVDEIFSMMSTAGFRYVSAPPSETDKWHRPSAKMIEGQHDALFYREWVPELENLVER